MPFCLALALTLALPQSSPGLGLPLGHGARPGLVVIVVDDFGVDLMAAYGEGASPPCTPNLDAFAAQGLLFRNAWASPSCSPMRAAALTGRHGFRTGIGTPGAAALPLQESILPEVLSGYSSAAVGKWHLGAGQAASHPNDSGFGRYAGSLGGALADYSAWLKTVDGTTSACGTYATTDTVDEALGALAFLPEPWFLWVAFNAPHTPHHAPPPALCPGGTCSASGCDALGRDSTPAELARGMVEALDTELGRLLDALAASHPDAFVFLVGDNGTASQATLPPFGPARAKGTLYEGGLNVPLVVRGPGVVPGECGALVSTADLHATLAQLAGVPSRAEDSVSFARCLVDHGFRPRRTVYAEQFSPNHQGVPPLDNHQRALRNVRYKLIRRSGQADELYDLWLDPWEEADLFPGLVPGTGAHSAWKDLDLELRVMGVG